MRIVVRPEIVRRVLERMGEDMAGRLVGQVLDRVEAGLELNARELTVMLTLAEAANSKSGDRTARMSVRRLARRVHAGKSVVHRVLRDLHANGLIEPAKCGKGPISTWWKVLPDKGRPVTVPPQGDNRRRESVPPPGTQGQRPPQEGRTVPPRPGHNVPPRPGHIPDVPGSTRGPTGPTGYESFSPDADASLAALRSPGGSAPLARPVLSPNGIGDATPTPAPEERERLARARQRELKVQLEQMRQREDVS